MATIQFRHRTFAGVVNDPYDTVKNDTWGDTATPATVTSRKVFGKGDNIRIHLGLVTDDGATAVATFNADMVPVTGVTLFGPGSRVHVTGLVRRIPGIAPFIAACGIRLANN